MIKRLFLGKFIEDLEKLEIFNIYIRTSYLEYWLYDFHFDSNKPSIDIDSLKIEDKINYSSNYELSFENIFNYKIENNKKLVFDSLYYVKVDSKNKVSLFELEQESRKILNLFKFLMPSKDIFIEDRFFYIENTKVEILEKQFYYKNELIKNSLEFDYIVRYDEKTSKDLIINWFNLYNKYGLLMEYLFTIFDDKIIKTTEMKFLFYMQWIEGFCREKFLIQEDEKEEFNQFVENLKKPFENNKGCDEYKWIVEQTKYGLKQNLLKQIKKLFQELKDSKYIEITEDNKNRISFKIKKYRDELTHLETNRKKYKSTELFNINYLLKGLIAYSILNELKIQKELVNNLNYIQMFINYNNASSYLFPKKSSNNI